MKRIRVLLIAPSARIVGGQSFQANELLNNLRDEPSVELRFLPIDPRLPWPLGLLQQIKYVRTIVTTVTYCALLAGRMWRYDVVHVFAAAYTSFLLSPTPAILLARVLRKKVLLNYRDGQAEDHLASWKNARRTMRLAHMIVVPSGFLVKVFERFGLRARAIHNTVDVQAFTYRPRPRPAPVFLHNRGLEPLYNVGCALRAFALVQERYRDATLTVAHDGSLRQAMERYAAELQLRNVRFIGAVSRRDMADAYNAADIYIMTPNIDNMPPSLLECFASGVPIVSTNAGGIPYIATHEETALLVNLDDHRAVADAAIRLLEEEGLAERLTERGREVVQRYTRERVRALWLSAYNELMRGGIRLAAPSNGMN